MKRVNIGAFSNSLATRIGSLILTASILGLVIISPIGLRQIARISGMNWILLSNIGQTYGAVSALVAALALGGVVISLLYQARDVQTNREQSSRTFHHDLLKLEMEDPLYMEALGAPWGFKLQMTDYDSLRQFNFVHMWVSYWEGLYMLREMTESTLRISVAGELFNGAVGREYWRAGRTSRIKNARGRHLRFAKILDEEYRKALTSGPPPTASLRSNPRKVTSTVSQIMPRTKPGIVVCVAAVGGILVGVLAGRQSSRISCTNRPLSNVRTGHGGTVRGL